jgi:hypothetical protein
MQYIFKPFTQIFNDVESLPQDIALIDNLNSGFDSNYKNIVLDHLNSYAATVNKKFNVGSLQPMPEQVRKNYPYLEFKFTGGLTLMFDEFGSINDFDVPNPDFKNFIASFNAVDHIGRKLLVSILNKLGWYDPNYCSKLFSFTVEELDGHIADFTKDKERFYQKFFIPDTKDLNFLSSINHFEYPSRESLNLLGSQVRADIIFGLRTQIIPKLDKSFIHLVSETDATSYVPFVTEKFAISVVAKSLFVGYAQPGWHEQLVKYYGFKLYTNLFDYSFDSILNPVERLVALTSMISKFSKLSTHDWHDLYLMEKDTIDYNYNHFFEKKYLNNLQQYIDQEL